MGVHEGDLPDELPHGCLNLDVLGALVADRDDLLHDWRRGEREGNWNKKPH